MKRVLMALILATPALGLIGCQDNSGLKADMNRLEAQVAALAAENKNLREGTVSTGEAPRDNTAQSLAVRLQDTERDLEAALKRIADLEKNKSTVVAKPTEGEAAPAETTVDEKAYADFKAMQDRYNDERRAARDARQAEQMAEVAKIAKENGIEFDPNDPRGSMMKIWADPVQRDKAMQVMRSEMTKRRLEPLGLDERQTADVLRIEDEGRTKMREAMQNARANGATQEDIQREMKTIQDQQKQDLQKVMTPEQYEEYEKSGAATGGMMPSMEDLGRMFPGGIPGMGGGGGFGGGGR